MVKQQLQNTTQIAHSSIQWIVMYYLRLDRVIVDESDIFWFYQNPIKILFPVWTRAQNEISRKNKKPRKTAAAWNDPEQTVGHLQFFCFLISHTANIIYGGVRSNAEYVPRYCWISKKRVIEAVPLSPGTEWSPISNKWVIWVQLTEIRIDW